ncbi:M3 family oligoendopeptidase [bacterium]|nr:M3 family oligoendopeptidase [bacterium]
MHQPQPKHNTPETIRWNLQDLFSGMDDGNVNRTLEKAGHQAVGFEEKYKGNIAGLTPAHLAMAFGLLESIISAVYRLSQYANLLLTVDTTNDAVKAFEMKIREQGTDIENHLLFFDLELGKISSEKSRAFLSAPELADYHYYIRRKQETAKYDLSEPEEKIINLKDLTGKTAFQNLYEEFTTEFKFEFELEGRVKTISGEELRALRQHADADVRRRAMKLFLERHRDNQLLITSVFNQVVKDYNIERKLRGFQNPMDVMNVYNDLAKEAIDALHDVTTESNQLVHRYYRIKAKLLALPDMTLADIYAPLPQVTRRYSWEEAQAMVLDAFRGFDQELYTLALSMFEENRVDAPALPGKRGGAFCSSSVPTLKPYVMLNFLGRLRDVSTMAHELGHAVHAMLSMPQKLVNFHSVLPLAETASIFSEMILTENLLSQETDKAVKISLLAGKLEEIFATSHRQNMFSRFERTIHRTISERLMSADELCAAYRHELGLMFGDAVIIPAEYQWEWAAIPHMVSVPFYVHSYNFANLLVMALYQQYKDEGVDFIPKFKRLLAAGSSVKPARIAAIAGADINHPEFWRKSFVLISSMIDELEQLIAD